MKKKKDREYHVMRVGHDEAIIQECGAPEGAPIRTLKRVKEGQNLSADETLFQMVPTADGHAKLKEIRLTPRKRSKKGPVQVASEEYREGWDRAFGEGRMVN